MTLVVPIKLCPEGARGPGKNAKEINGAMAREAKRQRLTVIPAQGNGAATGFGDSSVIEADQVTDEKPTLRYLSDLD